MLGDDLLLPGMVALFKLGAFVVVGRQEMAGGWPLPAAECGVLLGQILCHR